MTGVEALAQDFCTNRFSQTRTNLQGPLSLGKFGLAEFTRRYVE